MALKQKRIIDCFRVRIPYGPPFGSITQSVEQRTESPCVTGSIPVGATSDESVRTIRTLNININSNWVDFFVLWKIILLGKDGIYD